MNNKLILFLLLSILMVKCSKGIDKDRTIYKHSHNDYELENPLFDALDQNFNSIEADVYFGSDSLYVAHDFDKIRSGITLRELYLNPLKEEIKKHNGSVYGDGKEIILFIDIKSEARQTYELLHRILLEYKSVLTTYSNGVETRNSIVIVVSGNRPIDYMKEQKYRLAGFDGRIDDLDAITPSSIMPVISDDWTNCFSWDGNGEMPASEKKKLNEYVSRAHKKGCLICFWATPNQSIEQRKSVWKELVDARVDIIGCDNLAELNEYLDNNH